MTVTTVILPSTSDTEVHIGFAVKLDSETDQLDTLYRALYKIPGARVEFIDSKKLRADIPAGVPQKG